MSEESKNSDFLQGRRSSYFQPLKNKRPYQNTDTYENMMRPNRIDPRVFSVYKVLEPLREPLPPKSPIYYVEVGYVTSGYIEVLNQ